MHSDYVTQPGGRRPPRFPTLMLLVLLGSIGGLLALLHPTVRTQLLRFEYWTSDWRTALLSDSTTQNHSRIAVVLLDPNSAPDRLCYLPIPRDYSAQIIRLVSEAGAAVIGMDFYFVQATEPQKDNVLKETMKNTKNLVLGAVNENLRQFSTRQFAYQKEFLAEVGKPAGDITLHFDQDNVRRRTWVASKDARHPESFSRLIARTAGAQVDEAPPNTRTGWLWGPSNNPYPFQTILAQELLPEEPKSRQLLEQLKGKIVLIGLGFPYFDRHRTPLSVLTGDDMLGVMVHGQMIAQLLDKRIYSELPRAQLTAFLGGVLVVGLLLSWVFWTHASLLGQGVAAVALVSLDAVLFYWWRIYLPLAPALYVWFLAVMVGSCFRSLVNWVGERRAYGRAARAQAG